MRYMSLTELLDLLRVEARLSANVAHGVQMNDKHKALLARVQEDLYINHDWPALKTAQVVAIASSQRYAAYPENMVFEGIERAYAKDAASKWGPKLTYGIGIDQLNLHDSDASERGYPVQRWQNYLSPSAETMSSGMFEIWPVPDRAISLRFEGLRKLYPLTDPDHETTIDGPLVALYAAVEILAADKAEDASLKLQKAQERKRLLRIRQANADDRPINMARPGAGSMSRLRPGIDYIPSGS